MPGSFADDEKGERSHFQLDPDKSLLLIHDAPGRTNVERRNPLGSIEELSRNMGRGRDGSSIVALRDAALAAEAHSRPVPVRRLVVWLTANALDLPLATKLRVRNFCSRQAGTPLPATVSVRMYTQFR